MARLCQSQSGTIVAALWLLLFLLLSLPGWTASDKTPVTLLYDRPVLTVDPGMHTARITGAAVDAAGHSVVTGSEDKTLRIWLLSDGKLLQTIRMPAGPGNVGKIYAVAMSPDGKLVAAGGWTAGEGEEGKDKKTTTVVYLFDSITGKMTGRITALPEVTHHLVFSPNGRYLVVGLGGRSGLRIYDRDNKWAEAFRDTDYGAQLKGAIFAADGRLVTSSYDGKVRLYGRDFGLVVAKKATSGNRPRGLALSPDGNVLALGYDDTSSVNLLDAHTLASLPGPNTVGVNDGGFEEVAWSTDGRTLFAGGTYRDDTGKIPVLAWTDAGRGERRALSVGRDSIRALASLPGGQLLVASGDPYLTVLELDGSVRWVHDRPGASFIDQSEILRVSTDGTTVDFSFEIDNKSPLRFNLRALELTGDRPTADLTVPPKQKGLSIKNWKDSRYPTLNGRPIELKPLDTSRSLAIHPDGDRFVLGTDWSLRAIDATGKDLWRHQVPGDVWAVNVTGDGRIVVAAYHDATIRWHRMDDGREILALMVLGDKKNWVAWTPEGFYVATPDARGVLQWHVNHGFDAAGETVPVSRIPRLNRPAALPLVLQELETARALGIAEMRATHYDVQVATGMAPAPGARLHVLTIGVSDYGERAKHLRLNFAHKDARDVANALANTQGSLYAEVLPIYLHDATADKAQIIEAFAAMQRNMAKSSPGQDMAVVMFSGHGAMIDDRFYLLPYGVDASTLARVKASAFPASEFRAEVAKLAEHGRVLVLLDACRSGAVTADGLKLAPNADQLRMAIAFSNVTVLTSSRADEISREDNKWQNGAFTKVLLEALSRVADEDKNGLISMSELTAYVAAKLPLLTGGNQYPGIEQRFQSDIFVAGL